MPNAGLRLFRLTTNVCHMTTAHRIDQAIAQVVSEAVKSANLTQRDVSEQSGMPLVTLNRKLRGATSFTVVELASIAEVLNVSLTDLALRAERRALSPAA